MRKTQTPRRRLRTHLLLTRDFPHWHVMAQAKPTTPPERTFQFPTQSRYCDTDFLDPIHAKSQLRTS